jgi:hypothetical protein
VDSATATETIGPDRKGEHERGTVGKEREEEDSNMEVREN